MTSTSQATPRRIAASGLIRSNGRQAMSLNAHTFSYGRPAPSPGRPAGAAVVWTSGCRSPGRGIGMFEAQSGVVDDDRDG